MTQTQFVRFTNLVQGKYYPPLLNGLNLEHSTFSLSVISFAKVSSMNSGRLPDSLRAGAGRVCLCVRGSHA